MYDRKTEANEFVGDSVDEARASAARFYGVEESDLKVAVMREGEVAGLQGRAAVVAFPSSVVPGSKPGDDGGGRGGRGGRDRGGRGDRDRGGRGRDRDRPRGRDRGPRAERASPPSDERPAAEEPVASKGTAVGDLGEVGNFTLGVVERMGLGNFELTETPDETSDLVVLQIRGPASEALGSGGVRTSEALQLLVNQAAKQLTEDVGRVVVDVEGDSDERESSLTTLAGRAADRASDSGRSVALDPMNPRDRRIVHVALRDIDRIATMSIGEGRYRQVLVVPEGVSEYDDAQASQS